MYTYQCWSGGKDSTASIILEHINDMPKSTIIFSEVMFDRKNNISGEDPEHIKWIYKTAIPTFNKWGYEVKVVRAEKDYLDLFYHKIGPKTKRPERVGKYTGFVIGGMCAANSRLKTKPVKDFFKSVQDEYIQYIGIAIDEPKRLERLQGTNKVSLLEKYGYTEKTAYELCRQYGLLSPIYEHSRRGGCWFCPNSSYDELNNLRTKYPELWGMLRVLSEVENKASENFKYGLSFSEVEEKLNSMPIPLI